MKKSIALFLTLLALTSGCASKERVLPGTVPTTGEAAPTVTTPEAATIQLK